MTVDKRTAMRRFRRLMRSGNKAIQTRYQKATAVKVVESTQEQFERLIPEIPYIGGKKNPATDLLITSAAIIALYRVLKKQGVSVEEFGKILKEITTDYIYRYPAWVRNLMGWIWMNRFLRRFMHKRALISQQRSYNEDFVYEVVLENGQYEWGIDYLECGIFKFLQKQGETQLAEYMCELDYVMFPALGVRLKRTETIAQGYKRCNFRFK